MQPSGDQEHAPTEDQREPAQDADDNERHFATGDPLADGRDRHRASLDSKRRFNLCKWPCIAWWSCGRRRASSEAWSASCRRRARRRCRGGTTPLRKCTRIVVRHHFSIDYEDHVSRARRSVGDGSRARSPPLAAHHLHLVVLRCGVEYFDDLGVTKGSFYTGVRNS